MMGSHHQATEYFEIMFNRTKFNALPKELQAVLPIRRRSGLLRQ